MKEQMASFHVDSLSTPSFITLEYNMGTLFEEMVTKQLLIAGQKESSWPSNKATTMITEYVFPQFSPC